MTATSVRGRMVKVPALMGIAVLIAVILASLSVTAPAAADDAWAVGPADNEHGEGRPNYSYALDPGEQIEDGFVVRNTGDSTLVLKIAAADGFTTPDGVLDLRPLTEPAVGVGAWIELEQSEITLAPSEQVEVPFTLSVPGDATPGDHTGGVVAVLTSGDGTVQVQHRFGSRVHVRVSGDYVVSSTASDVSVAQAAALNPIAAAPVTVTYTLSNTGTVRTRYTEVIVATGPGGVGRVEQRAQIDEILPGTEILRTVQLPEVWAWGYTNVEVELIPEAIDGELGEPSSVDGGTWAIPWGILATVLIVAVAAIAVGRRRAAVTTSRKSENPDGAEERPAT